MSDCQFDRAISSENVLPNVGVDGAEEAGEDGEEDQGEGQEQGGRQGQGQVLGRR